MLLEKVVRIMKSFINALVFAFVISLAFVGCGSSENDIYVNELNLANDRTAMEGISGKAGDHIKASLDAAESEDFVTAVTELISAVETKMLSNEQMEAAITYLGTIQAYLSGKPELRTDEVIKLEQKFTAVWTKNFKG